MIRRDLILAAIGCAALIPSSVRAELDCRNNPEMRGCKDSSFRGSVSAGLGSTGSPDSPGTDPDPDPPGQPGSSPGKKNNGHGNGDQDPPGNSAGHNNAENSSHSGQGNSAGGKGRGNGPK